MTGRVEGVWEREMGGGRSLGVGWVDWAGLGWAGLIWYIRVGIVTSPAVFQALELGWSERGRRTCDPNSSDDFL